MIPTQSSNHEKWQRALIRAVLGFLLISFLTFIIFLFEPPMWLTGLLCLCNILWLSALPIMLVALLADAPFPDINQEFHKKEPAKIEDLLADDNWNKEWRSNEGQTVRLITPAVECQYG